MAFPYITMAIVFFILGFLNIFIPGSMIGMRKEESLFKQNQEAKSLLQKINGLIFVGGAFFIALYYIEDGLLGTDFFSPTGFLIVLLLTFPIKRYTKRLKTLAELNRTA